MYLFNRKFSWSPASGGSFDPMSLEPLQWLSSVLGTEAIDQTSNELDANITKSNCVVLDGDVLVATHLVGTETVVSSGGTSTPTVGVGEITFTVGTCWNLILSDGTTYLMSGGNGAQRNEYDVSSGANHGLWTTGAGGTTTLRSGTTDDFAPNLINGCSKVIYFNGTDAYADTGLTTELNYIHQTGVFNILVTCQYLNNPSDYIFANQVGSTTAGISFQYYSSGKYRILINTGAAYITTIDTGIYPSGDMEDVRIRGDGTNLFIKAGSAAEVDLGVVAYGGTADVSSNLIIGKRNTNFVEMNFAKLVIDDVYGWEAKDAYGTTLPDSTGMNAATLVNTSFNYIPALADGTDDVAGLGLTNPGGSVHNNFEGFIQQKAANTEFLDNAFWSADGVNYDEKSFGDLITHLDLWDFVVAVGDSPLISDIITFPQDFELTPDEYTGLINWLSSQGETGDHMVPFEVLNGGIGPGEMWYTGDSEHILLVEHVDTDTIIYLPGDTTFTYSGDIPTSAASNDSLGDCTEIDVGNTCATIGTYAFYSCSDLATVDISTSVTTIGCGAFDSCSSLTSLVIPNSVTTISDYVFYASGLVSIVIGSGVTSLGASGNTAFTYCPDLETITVDANNPSYSSLAGVLFNKDQTALFLYPIGNSVTDYTIPGSVTTIGDNAFRSGNATSITIPTSVASIGTAAFGYCINLETITVDANNPSYSSLAGVLFNKDQTTLTAYPGGSVVTDYTIPSSVTTIGEYSFHGGLNLTDLIIPTGVTTIGDNAFGYCVSLASMIIPDNVTTISNNIFDGCTFTSLDSYVSRGVLNGGGASLYGSDLTTVHVRATDESYTAGADTIGSKAVTVIKDLT